MNSIDPAVQAAAEAIHKAGCTNPECGPPGFYYEHDYQTGEVAVAAVTPLIRAQAFTEAAEAIEALEDGSTEPFVLTEKAAALVRGLGEETASVDSKIN